MTLLSHADYERIAANLSYPTEAFIGGTFAPALSGETMPTVNPATGKEIARVASCGREDVDKAVAAARKAFESGAWSRMHPSERKKILMRFIGLIEKHQVELAVLESLDSGKPVRECLLTDLPETIECLEWHAECADKQYGGISPSGDGRLGLIVREPAGVVACVLPWNFPLMMVGWKLGPALAEGNSVILKPASVTSLSTLKLAEFAAEAVVQIIDLFPNGIAKMNGAIPGVVESSNNVGTIDLCDGRLFLTAETRAAYMTTVQDILDKVDSLAAIFGAEVTYFGDYVPWEYRPDSALRLKAQEVYQQMFGEEMHSLVVHAGIECAMFIEKDPEMDAIAVGPNCEYFHSPGERMSIKSTQKMYQFVTELLKNLK